MDYTFWLGKDGEAKVERDEENERALENSPLYPGVGVPESK